MTATQRGTTTQRLTLRQTPRGLAVIEFADANGAACAVQQSGDPDRDCLWLGVDGERRAHLDPVTHRENVLRGVGFSAVNARKTHCIRGHEFTSENTYVKHLKSGSNERGCRRCDSARQRDKRARRKEEQ